MVTRVRKPITPKAKAAAARAKAKAPKTATKTATSKTAVKATHKPTAKTAKATPTRKATTTTARKGKKNVSTDRANREAGYDENGFVNGSDASAIAAALVKGGESRVSITEALTEILDPTTRNGTPKNISSMVSGMVSKLQEKGYTIESSFRMIAP